MTKVALDNLRPVLKDRKRHAETWRMQFIIEAIGQGLTRDLRLTWDGGRDLPSAFADLHVAAFHARGKTVRESITEAAIGSAWHMDDESLTVIPRVVAELLKP